MDDPNKFTIADVVPIPPEATHLDGESEEALMSAENADMAAQGIPCEAWYE